MSYINVTLNLKIIFIHYVGTFINNLCSSLKDNKSLDCDSDRLVNNFTDFLSNKGNVYFEKHIRYPKKVFSNDNSSYSLKKWFDESCKQKKRTETAQKIL